jgi:sulfoxide reductase heme-binding subunit YedZ
VNTLWYIARGAGLSALLVLTVATVLGALGSVKSARPASRVVAQYLHRTAALLGIALVLLHVTMIVIDRRSHLGVAGVLVPLRSSYRPGAVALGTLAAYTFLVVASLGLARGRLAHSARGAATWRALHALSYGAWTLAVVHGLLAGTDRSQRWMLLLVLACVVAALVGVCGRLLSPDDVGAPVPAASSGR